jgi:hypothetical protein
MRCSRCDRKIHSETPCNEEGYPYIDPEAPHGWIEPYIWPTFHDAIPKIIDTFSRWKPVDKNEVFFREENPDVLGQEHEYRCENEFDAFVSGLGQIGVDVVNDMDVGMMGEDENMLMRMQCSHYHDFFLLRCVLVKKLFPGTNQYGFGIIFLIFGHEIGIGVARLMWIGHEDERRPWIDFESRKAVGSGAVAKRVYARDLK